MSETTATVSYWGNGAQSATIYNIPLDELGDVLEGLRKNGLRAHAYARDDIDRELGGVRFEGGDLKVWREVTS